MTLKHDAPIKVLEGMIFEPADPDFHPFAWVQDLFDERARLIKIDPNDVTAIVIKLVLNSLYGKLAQYVGMAGQPPSYASPWVRDELVGKGDALSNWVQGMPDSFFVETGDP